MLAGCALTPADRYSTKMASEGASGEQLPPVQTLVTAVLGSVDAKCEFNMDNLSKPELLTLLSIMEGELEARDLVIEALRAQRKEVFLQERYGHYSLTDPFLALQRDFECSGSGGATERRPLGSSPISVLEAVMAHCRKMQERMSAQLASAESRQKRLEMEKLQLQSLEQEHRKLTAQLKDEREKNKHIVMMLVRECKQLATRVVEESQRFDELQARLDEESHTTGRLQEELSTERQRSQQMEAKMEKQLSEFDTEREQLRARLGREEAESQSLRHQVEQLRTEQSDGKNAAVAQPAAAAEPAAAAAAPSKPKALKSVSIATEPVCSRPASCQTDLTPSEVEAPKKNPLSITVKPSPANYVGLSLPKTTGRGIVHSSSGGLAQTENGSEGQAPHPLPTGVSPRVQAARYKFQEQDQNGTASQTPPARDLSPTNRDNFVAKQQARHTVTQVLSRFTSPPAGGAGPLRPGLPHSASEGGPFPGRLSHPIGLKSPTVARIDRGNPPPIPPKKPGLSQTPSPPHPPIKVVGDSSRSPGAGIKPATPQLPPKPALDLVPALTASQVGACPRSPGPGRGPQRQPAAACAECPPVINPTSTVSSPSSIIPSSSISAPSSRSPSSLAPASGWCPSVVSSLSGGGLAALDGGRPLLLQAASQGNVTLLSMLLNQPDLTTTTSPMSDNLTSSTTSFTTSTTAAGMEDQPHHLDEDHHLYHTTHQTSALFAAAQNGHTECVKLLLFSGTPADVTDVNGLTPLHLAAAHGHSSCADVLLSAGAAVDAAAADGGQTPLFVACEAGHLDCVQVLLNAGADRSRTTSDGCTALHAVVRSGHVDTLRLLLCHPPQADPTVTPDPSDTLTLPAALLNQANSDGWTAAHMAAALGLKECLEVLCSHREQDIQRRDKCNRTIHDVATDDCKDLLENLNSYRVLVRLQCSGGGAGSMCPVEALEEEAKWGTSSQLVLCRVSVDRSMPWSQLGSVLSQSFTSHLHILCGDSPQGREEVQRPPLGLGPSSISSILIGDTEWLPGQELPLSPWDLVRKPLSQCITVRLKGLSESSLDELALESLFSLPLLHNYVRLVEQYGNLIFHGLEGSCQEYVASLVARCIKVKQESGGHVCDVVTVEVEESLTKDQLLDIFITCGFLLPGVSSSARSPSRCVVVLLEGLEKAASLTGLLGDLCHSLDNRGSASPLHLSTGPHHFCEASFLIATLSKPRLQGSELRLQQHFRWVTLRWDQEPLHGLLGRHLRRKLLHKTGTGEWTADGVMERSVQWVSQVWQQLNACLSRLGTHEALLGPQLFLSCPLLPNNTQAVVRWLARLWNAVVVPRVEEAIISRVTAKRCSSFSSSTSSSPSLASSSSLHLSPSNCGLSPGQQAVVKAALSILVNKAVLLGCPLPRHETDRYLLEFRGGSLSLSAIGSFKGNNVGGGRKGRDSSKLRRSNTSPRKKGSPALNWSCGSSFREGSLSNSDLSFTNGTVQRETVGLSVFSDDETDLIRELQSMCSSKSEPDISKISQTKDDLFLFSSVSSQESKTQKPEQETNVQQEQQRTTVAHQSFRSSDHTDVQSSNRRSTGLRAKSQLPVPSSRGQQARASTAATTGSSSNNNNHSSSSSSSSSSSKSPIRTQTPPNRSRNSSSSSNNNYYHRNNIDNNRSHEDIWILHRDLHENK